MTSKKDYKSIGQGITKLVKSGNGTTYLNTNRLDKFFLVNEGYWNDLPGNIALKIKLKNAPEGESLVDGFSVAAINTNKGPAISISNLPIYMKNKPGYITQTILYSQIECIYKKISPSAYIEIVRLRELSSQLQDENKKLEERVTKLEALIKKLMNN